jgi:hypothetical protein
MLGVLLESALITTIFRGWSDHLINAIAFLINTGSEDGEMGTENRELCPHAEGQSERQ